MVRSFATNLLSSLVSPETKHARIRGHVSCFGSRLGRAWLLSVDRFISNRAAVLPYFQRRLFATPLGSLSLGFPFGRPFLRFTLGFLLSLTLGWPFLRFALGFLFSLTLGLALGLLLSLTLGLALRFLLSLTLGLAFGLPLHLALSLLLGLTLGFSLRLTFACFSLRSATFGDLSLRLLTRYLALLRNLSLRSFFTRLLLGSHTLSPCRVPGVEYIQQDRKIQQVK